jgi:hypothetical protein
MDFKYVGCEGVDWFYLAHGGPYEHGKESWVSYNSGNFFNR